MAVESRPSRAVPAAERPSHVPRPRCWGPAGGHTHVRLRGQRSPWNSNRGTEGGGRQPGRRRLRAPGRSFLQRVVPDPEMRLRGAPHPAPEPSPFGATSGGLRSGLGPTPRPRPSLQAPPPGLLPLQAPPQTPPPMPGAPSRPLPHGLHCPVGTETPARFPRRWRPRGWQRPGSGTERGKTVRSPCSARTCFLLCSRSGVPPTGRFPNCSRVKSRAASAPRRAPWAPGPQASERLRGRAAERPGPALRSACVSRGSRGCCAPSRRVRAASGLEAARSRNRRARGRSAGCGPQRASGRRGQRGAAGRPALGRQGGWAPSSPRASDVPLRLQASARHGRPATDRQPRTARHGRTATDGPPRTARHGGARRV